MTLTPATNKQLPDHAILDYFNKQTYLGNSYVANTNVQVIASDSSETALFVLANPASNASPSGNLSLFNGVRKLIVGQDGLSAVTFRFYAACTYTGGTPITPMNLRTGSFNTSKMLASLLPTVSAMGTFVAAFSVNYQQIDSAILFILDPNSNILVTAEPGAVNTEVVAEFTWYEL